MARNQVNVSCPDGQWTELTNADVTNITIQCISGTGKLRVTTGAVDPGSAETAGLTIPMPYGLLNEPLTKIAAGGGNRVWARGFSNDTCIFYVDHA